MISDTLRDKLQNCYPRWSPTMYRMTLAGFVALAFCVPLALVALPFVEFFNGMAAQPKGKTQMTYGRVYAKALVVDQVPVAGTVPRGYTSYPFAEKANSIEDAREVGLELKNRVPVTLDAMQHGQRLYNVYCIVCHGRRGEGDGSVTGVGRFPAPPSLHTDQARGYEDGTMYHMITKGVGKMPAYADKLEPDERWRVIHYVRALQRSMNPQPEDLKP